MKADPVESNVNIQALKLIAGKAEIYPYAELADSFSKQIAKAVTPETQVTHLVYPQTQEELAAVVACAHQHQWPLLPCGNGSKLGWGGLAKGTQLVVSTARLNRIIDHAVGDLTVTVEAGVTLADLQTTLMKVGQFLALDPAYPETATVGGIIATADTGSWRQRYGGVRDMLLGCSFVRADGQVAKAGGRVVKNVAGYDLMKLMTGSYGTLGILTQATFRVYPAPVSSQTVRFTGTPEAIAQAAKTLLASALTPTAMDVLSASTVNHLGWGQGMGLVVRFQGLLASVQEQAGRSLSVGQSLNLSSHLYSESEEASLWQALRELRQTASTPVAITCKLGVPSSEAVATLSQIDQLTTMQALGVVHTGSGLGYLRLDSQAVEPRTLLEIRQLCQAKGGFLTVLEAPATLKQPLDVWGYTGNALELMRRLKHQFDPQNLLSPHRFVGGI